MTHRRHPLKQVTPIEHLRLKGLSPREAEATLLVTRGLLVREVAERMGICEGTAKALIARAREKLGCHSIRELSAYLLCEGVVHPSDLVTAHPHGESGRRSKVDEKWAKGLQKINPRMIPD